MKAQEILEGIKETLCRPELTAYVDLIELAAEQGGLDYSLPESLLIEQAVIEKIYEFDHRVYH